MAPPKRKKPQPFLEDEIDDDDFIDVVDDVDVIEEDSSTTVTEFDQKKFMQLLNNKDVQKMIEVLNQNLKGTGGASGPSQMRKESESEEDEEEYDEDSSQESHKEEDKKSDKP